MASIIFYFSCSFFLFNIIIWVIVGFVHFGLFKLIWHCWYAGRRWWGSKHWFRLRRRFRRGSPRSHKRRWRRLLHHSSPPTRVEALNTKIKTENLSSYATVKIENSDGTKDSGAQGTGPAGWEKTPRRSSLRTFRPVELYSAREESLKRELSLSLALSVCVKFWIFVWKIKV